MRLQDKIAVITGASSDIGEGIVKRFVQEGAKVVLVSRNLDSLEKVRSNVGNEENTVSMTCDLTNESETLQVADQVVEKYGRIDILVNNAGAINDPIHFHEMPESEIEKLIDVNMKGVFHMTKAVLGKMSEVKNGCIVNIGSISSERAIPRVHLAVYSATKAAISMFTKSIAVEYARKNIRCNCVNPGIINSGMIKPYLEDAQARKVLEERLPLGKIGEPEDVANATLYFASDEAKWVTGTVLNVDGGRSASEG
ncbi:MAG: glucose 1-dehydrogenase [Nitrosopumilaceae archaeon]|nr:SDR family oxidoreductase [Nitrosopumilaceae archaeon]NIU02012.1 SDR family oxidoreductase [Nitrosopumilaceae archaeon]NIU88398.1 glucose 1-dehydrogenase [Nitrosopumilaceae archaeon]NIV66173.1 glucose 1-dehydrogenase [Nitrosopumilaceae archaeon]NIX62613.1 glucose 1-dehydrogenase [Nitrosopumilaceae archaeon]